jgi:hypothetical protein
MTKNPFYNAGAALLYIMGVVFAINFGSRWATEEANQNLLLPIGMLSLFVLSASVMGYVFLSQPIMMFLDGQRKEGISLFLKTVAVFAGITAIILGAGVFLFR